MKSVYVERCMSNNNKHQHIPNWTCISLQGEKYLYTHALKLFMININPLMPGGNKKVTYT